MITVKNYPQQKASIDFAKLPAKFKKGDAFMSDYADLYGEDKDIDKAINSYISSLNSELGQAPKKPAKVDKLKKMGLNPYTASDIQTKSATAKLVPVSNLVVEKENPRKSIDKAKGFMKGAFEGKNPKRGPIKVNKRSDGKYLVVDGNATTVAAREMNIGKLYVEVEKAEPAKPAPKVDAYSRERYKGVFGDYDGDGILNVDDPNPRQAGDTETVEEVKLSDEIAALIDFRKKYDDSREEFVGELRKKAQGETDILSRTKTPYSIINKLRRQRLTGPQGITDVVGTMVVFPDQAKLEDFKKKVDSGEFGKVLDSDDYYKNPKAGYKAYHWNVIHKGAPVEIQAKTERMKTIAGANHTLYKEGKNDGALLLKITNEMEKADRGDTAAAARIDPIINDKDRLYQAMTEKGATPGATPKKTKTPAAPLPDLKKIKLLDKTFDQNARRMGVAGALLEKEQESKLFSKKKRLSASERGIAMKKIRAMVKVAENKPGELTTKEVIALGRKINAERSMYGVFMDLDADHKTRRWPTEKNLKIWAKNPGKSDLLGVDNNEKHDATIGVNIGLPWMMIFD
jgi:ppGpp synthetase/RelA/SpoT-type nucleotidyltranferase